MVALVREGSLAEARTKVYAPATQHATAIAQDMTYNPRPSDAWKAMSPEWRMTLIAIWLGLSDDPPDHPQLQGIVRMEGMAKVVLFTQPGLTTSARGEALMNAERVLREHEPCLEVFLEPKGDMNKLRQRLRGVSVD